MACEVRLLINGCDLVVHGGTKSLARGTDLRVLKAVDNMLETVEPADWEEASWLATLGEECREKGIGELAEDDIDMH